MLKYGVIVGSGFALSLAKNGLAAGDIWPCDLGPDLFRGFRALKTWFTFETLDADRIGACMEQNCMAARKLADRIEAGGLFEVSAPVVLNIVRFSAKPKSCAAVEDGDGRVGPERRGPPRRPYASGEVDRGTSAQEEHVTPRSLCLSPKRDPHFGRVSY